MVKYLLVISFADENGEWTESQDLTETEAQDTELLERLAYENTPAGAVVVGWGVRELEVDDE